MDRNTKIAFGLVAVALLYHERVLTTHYKVLKKQRDYLYQKAIDEDFKIIIENFDD